MCHCLHRTQVRVRGALFATKQSYNSSLKIASPLETAARNDTLQIYSSCYFYFQKTLLEQKSNHLPRHLFWRSGPGWLKLSIRRILSWSWKMNPRS